MPKLSIIVPAYDEEDAIRDVVRSLMSVRPKIRDEAGLDDVEVIVVNDGSTDRTGKYLEELVNEGFESFRVVTHEENRGYGAALKTGFDASDAEFLSFMDADGTIAPESFINMYKTCCETNSDMVVGTRFGTKDSGMPFTRKMGNLFFAGLLSFLSGQRVKDSASGIRLFRRSIMPQLLPLPDGLHFTPAMSTKALHEKLKISEVPVPYAVRDGDSKLNVISDGIRFLKIIVGTVLLYNPFKVFLLVGLMSIFIAALLMAVPIADFFTKPELRFSDYIYRSIGALYFFTAGVQIILFGVLARFIVSTFFRYYERGTWIHKLNRSLRVYDWMGLYGAVVLWAGVVINAFYLGQYYFQGDIRMHWASLLIAAGFIIVGLQMVITGVVMRILKDIRAATELK